jgi:HAE1 family hydrophobic/amphiphilic exporter-1
MNLSALFIRRPIMTTLSMLSILLFGVIGYRLLPVSDLPNVDRPVISVNASLPGASPETMATSVATPLEKEFTTISGIESMSSSSSFGSTSITLEFSLARDIDSAAQDVQAAIARVARRLPANMPAPPSYRKSNPADMPVLFLILTGRDLPLSELDELGQTLMAQRISMVDGVAQVQVWGSQKYAVRIELDPKVLAARQIGVDDVATVINEYNVNMPLGILSGPNKVASIQANGQLTEANHYRPLIVAFRNGQPVRLGDLGEVGDSVENDKTAAWYCTPEKFERSIGMGVFKQPGTNTVEVADAVKAVLPLLREKMPAGADLIMLRDGSKNIRESFRDVKFTLMLTLVLVVLVIFLFLRNLSATIIPSMTLPMSIVGTFTVMYLLSYSLDNLSLMALTLSVGFVVDDAIVMLENCVRHLEMGKTRRQAALDGSREIGFTIVSMTLSLAAVFIPVLFMGGYVGRLFREFSVTIGAAVLVSGFVSLTLTPMLCSRFLRDPGHIKHGWAYRVTEAGFQALLAFYSWSLLKVLKHRLVTMLVSVTILGGSVWLFMAIPKGFIPSEDRDMIMVRTQAAQDISNDAMVAHQLELMKIVQQDPNVVQFMSNVGSGPGGGGSNGGSMNLILKPRAERELSADQIIEKLRPKLNSVPGIRTTLTNPLSINIGGRQSRGIYQVTLQDPDTDELYLVAEKIEQKMRELPGIQDVSSDMQLMNPELNVEIARDKAFTLGVTPLQIETALLYAYGTAQVSTIYTADNTYQVIMELAPQYQTDPSVLSLLHVRSAGGQLIPLKAVTTQTEGIGPLQINHTGQLPSVTISFNLKPGVSLGQAIDDVKTATATMRPSGMTLTLQGTAQAFQSSLSSMGILLILAIVVIYIVLGILYESFYHPITILSALPFAGFGALLTLMVFGAELSIYAFIGIIMLVGLVKKNGIIMIDFAIETQRKEGKSPHDAIHEACMIRFRPIMMTTMAALMAGLPIALGWGAGAEARRPLGLAVVGGLLFSQTLTLYVTPVFYVVVERIRSFFHGEDRVGEEEVAIPQVVPQED